MSANAEILSRKIAESVEEHGGRAYYVGGCVRDRLLGRENKDIDIEVHGIAPDVLKMVLDNFGNLLSYGKSFGIYSIRGSNLDIAMPRRERKTGEGHRDFDVDVDPFIGTFEAARRRDFTVNALMEDILTGEIIDHFGGRRDLKDGILRCVDETTFIEDPLRVLRACQFAARFNFEVDERTLDLCSKIDLSSLSKERVDEELRKALLQSEKPSVFFELLREMGQLDPWFSELKGLIGLRQDPLYHPEGDVWTHTMRVIDEAAGFLDQTEDPYCFMLLGLCHDLGKIVTTTESNGRIHSYEHETKGMPLIRCLVRRFSERKQPLAYLSAMVPLHMLPFALAQDNSSIKATNRMFDKTPWPKELILFALADKGKEKADPKLVSFLYERLAVYREYMARPFVSGEDLIEAGLEPSPAFSKALDYAHKLRLAGIDKNDALKQTLAYAGKLNK